MAAVLWGGLISLAASGQGKLPETPKQLAAVREGADLRAPKTVSILVDSRSIEEPVLPVRAEKFAATVRKHLQKLAFRPVEDATTAQWNLELVVEPHQRWRTAPSKDDPYLFLLVRDHATANVLYCGYRRVGLLYEFALNDLLKDFEGNIKVGAAGAQGDLNGCAKEAMRLPGVGL